MFCGFLWLLSISTFSPCSFAASDSGTAEKALARKDYESAKLKIKAENQAEMDQCAKRTGPMATACTIQAQAKRDAANEDADVMLDRAGRPPPLPDKERGKMSKDARDRAKADYGVAKARVMKTQRAANAACSTLEGDVRKTCMNEVSIRTANAKAQAKYLYKRDMLRAKAIAQ